MGVFTQSSSWRRRFFGVVIRTQPLAREEVRKESPFRKNCRALLEYSIIVPIKVYGMAVNFVVPPHRQLLTQHLEGKGEWTLLSI